MVILFVSTTLLTITFYGKIFFTEQTRNQEKEDKRKVGFYNSVNFKTTETKQDSKTIHL
jgi:hypothetical protein